MPEILLGALESIGVLVMLLIGMAVVYVPLRAVGLA